MLSLRTPSLVGNRCDLVDTVAPESRVTAREGADMAREIGALTYLETSAKTGQNVLDAFRVLFTYQQFPAARRAALAVMIIASRRADRGTLEPLVKPVLQLIARRVWDSPHDPVWQDALAAASPPGMDNAKCVIM